ncbi:FUN14 domain-containing protein [Candidatus Dependentiae bacterium]
MEVPEVKIPEINIPDTLGGLDLSIAELGRAATYLGIGVVIGLLCRKYLRFVLTVAVVTFLLVKGLEHRQILTVDWGGLYMLLGFDSTATFETILNILFDWVKEQSLVAISAMIGFFIGYKAG